jgi:hypothetical protein
VYLTLIAPYLSGDNAPGILSPIFIRAISVKDVSVVAVNCRFGVAQNSANLLLVLGIFCTEGFDLHRMNGKCCLMHIYFTTSGNQSFCAGGKN